MSHTSTAGNQLNEATNALQNSPNCYIYRVPRKLRVAGGDRYDPHVVSIGPYHHATANNLEVTTDLKQRYRDCFIRDSSTPNTVLELMNSRIGSLQSNARLYYASSFNINDNDFRDMLILDGCFIIGVLYRNKLAKDHIWKRNDMLFNNKSIVSSIRRDLVLLENQIPYIVLDTLFQIITPPRDGRTDPNGSTLKHHIMSFFDPILPSSISQPNLESETENKHILGLLREHLIPIKDRRRVEIGIPRTKVGFNDNWEHTTNATELEEAGVKFRRKDINEGPLDISFEKGKFEIPPFYFGESWTVLLPNMIALEQCHGDYKDMITSYVLLMDNLVDSRSDVKLLYDKDIIIGSSKEHQTIAEDINNLSKEAIYETFYYDGICQKVNKYRRLRFPRWRAHFMKNIINTPWALVSVSAATLLLLLSTAQIVIALVKD